MLSCKHPFSRTLLLFCSKLSPLPLLLLLLPLCVAAGALMLLGKGRGGPGSWFIRLGGSVNIERRPLLLVLLLAGSGLV